MHDDPRLERTTLSGRLPETPDAAAPAGVDPATGMHRDYWVLSAAERARGFVRPVRTTYRHNRCGTTTTMGRVLAETYARDPNFYSHTFCCACRDHLPVPEFVWEGTSEQVGS